MLLTAAAFLAGLELEPAYDFTQVYPLAPLVSMVIRNYCGWHIWPESNETLTLDGTGGTILPLPTLRLTNLLSVYIDGIAETDVEWSERGLLKRYGGACWPTTYRSVAVAFTHGYAAPPPDVVSVAMAMVTRVLSNPEQVRSEAVKGYSVTYSIPGTGEPSGFSLTRPEASILAAYQIPARP